MIKIDNIDVWGFKHAIRGMELELLKYLFNYCVNYKNGIKSDNRAKNLEWCTYSDNTLHSFKNGLQKFVGNQYGRFEVKKYDKG